jgi:hypothetical protein
MNLTELIRWSITLAAFSCLAALWQAVDNKPLRMALGIWAVLLTLPALVLTSISLMLPWVGVPLLLLVNTHGFRLAVTDVRDGGRTMR